MKNKIVVFTAVIVFGFSGLALAQMNDKGKEMMKDKSGMMGDKDEMMGMHGMMMKHAMGPSMSPPMMGAS